MRINAQRTHSSIFTCQACPEDIGKSKLDSFSYIEVEHISFAPKFIHNLVLKKRKGNSSCQL